MKKNTNLLDDQDLSILRAVQNNARTTTASIAELLNISETPVWRRWKRLEESSFILRYQAILNPLQLGFNVRAFAMLSVDCHTSAATGDLEARILACSEVVSLHNVTGEYDFIVQLLCYSVESYNDFVEKVLRAIPHIKTIRSFISLREVHSSTMLPL